MFKSKAERQGFTLIELLVVIAIIAILAAILFPVFAKAREKAKQATCTSNLKQMGLAIAAYCQDYDEFMPYVWNDSFYLSWIALIHPYIANCKWDGGGPNTSKIFFCPADKDQILIIGGKPVTNYAYHARLGNIPYISNPTYLPRTLAKCNSPSQDAIMIDARCKALGVHFFDIATTSYSGKVAPRHFGGMNILYADNHVAWFNVASASETQIKTIFMWNPGGTGLDFCDWPY